MTFMHSLNYKRPLRSLILIIIWVFGGMLWIIMAPFLFIGWSITGILKLISFIHLNALIKISRIGK